MIPDEAVAAAAKVIALGDIERTHYLVIAHRALEAAAPYIAAQAEADAWDEGEEAGRDNADNIRGFTYEVEHKSNPYRSKP